MDMQENNITKLCSFYVSDWHLVTMLLPYVNQKINEQAKIVTILEKDIKQNINTLIGRLNLKNEEKILSLNWSKSEEIKSSINELKENQELVIFINGDKEFMQRQNNKLDKYFASHFMKHSIKVINCYDLIQFNGSMQEILDKHDKILNTSGEKEIGEVFADYEKRNHLEEKAVVGLE